MKELPDRSQIVGDELVMPDFGIGIIGNKHGSDSIRDAVS